MAVVPTYGRYNEVAGGVVIEEGKVCTRNVATADAFTLPVGAPIGYWFILRNIGSGVQTLTAPAGGTMDGGVTTVATDETVIVRKETATVWSATPSATVDA